MSHERLINDLMALPKFGNGPGLDRMRALLDSKEFWEWHQQVTVFHIVGSNGKGSVATLLHGFLTQLFGDRVGLYTSPHLLRFNERIRIGRNDIPDTDLAQQVEQFREIESRYLQHYPKDTVGAFEAFTTLALRYFQQRQVTHLVLEAGIGGRYDSTRVMAGEYAGLTSLDLEHTQLLGDTLEAIAQDKLDILRPFGTAIIGRLNNANLIDSCKVHVAGNSAKALSLDNEVQITDLNYHLDGMSLDLVVMGQHFPNLYTRLFGDHQIDNIAMAIALLKTHIRQEQLSISEKRIEDAVRAELATLTLPGRFELVSTDPSVFIDSAHTPDAIARTVETLNKTVGDQVILVVGVSHDKEVEEIVSRLAPVATTAICTQAYHKGSPVGRISEALSNSVDTVVEAPTFEMAIQYAQSLAKEQNRAVLVAGGLFLAMEAREVLHGRDPQQLRFF